MLRFAGICILAFLLSAHSFSQQEISVKLLPENCITPSEASLYKLINEYRRQKGLPAVRLSVSLSYVARAHAKDQTENYKQSKRCNMHSWSSKGEWTACCYTADHKQSECMWNKPRELTNYQGDGYEISFWSTYNYDSPEAFAKDILEGWKKSQGHNDVIVNKSIWKGVSWKAMGVGVYGEYTNVWFGKEEDSAGEPKMCE